MKKATRRTAAEAIAELNADPDFVARRRLEEERRQAKVVEWRRAEAPLVQALNGVGLRVDSVWDLVETSKPYPEAIGILLEQPTMKIFELMPQEGFDWVMPEMDRDFELIAFDGQPRLASWVPVEMRPVSADERGRPLRSADFPWSLGELMLRQKAYEALGPVLETYGELLPLECRKGPLWTLNVTRLVDALDAARSQLLRVPDSGKILRVASSAPATSSPRVINRTIFLGPPC